MTPLSTPDADFERRLGHRLLEVLIRASVLFAMALLCYRVLSPFLPLTIWALIFAVTVYPLHLRIAAHLGGRSWLAATLLVLLGIAVLVVPIALLMSSLGDSIRTLIEAVQQNTLQIPAPPEAVAAWPIIGEKLHAMWSLAHDDLPALVQSMQPKIGELARSALGFVAGIVGGLLAFLGALVLAGIFMAFGEKGARACQSVFERLAGEPRGASLARLSTATVRAVAQGVVGVALIQAILVGLALLVAGVPWAGALAAMVLVLGIVQVPAVIVTLPAIAWIWSRGGAGTGEAIIYTALLLVSGMADNVLKPLMLGRGVDVPMPVILVGALGGMATGGIIGMFVGATLLALAWQIFTGWVDENPDANIPPEG
ncbi:AI-2E family transporter [Limobrevibacterium gyesilva]|uniref:AI-2E family transporter n=1 Tax=Limobrevibacterium gyesilva TaxID=2991712 RepID=A0AA41YI85_9PROT|nr:AI-2E family transporter [Limobrevibacterium gyesilva]MCW3473439.1 AI-2E family transporter [Limobrevibacterium gyesilva]